MVAEKVVVLEYQDHSWEFVMILEKKWKYGLPCPAGKGLQPYHVHSETAVVVAVDTLLQPRRSLVHSDLSCKHHNIINTW